MTDGQAAAALITEGSKILTTTVSGVVAVLKGMTDTDDHTRIAANRRDIIIIKKLFNDQKTKQEARLKRVQIQEKKVEIIKKVVKENQGQGRLQITLTWGR